MKRTSFLITILVSVFAYSCIKDMSNTDLKEISPIVIDTAGVAPAFVVFQLDTLRVNPTVSKEGADAGQLKYEWTMNAYQGYKRVVGNTMKLAAQVSEAPNSTVYVLILTVTDTVTSLKAFYTWNVTVNPRFGEGLIVADTKDGSQSDLNLIMAYNFTSSFLDESDTRIFRNLYSKANETSINGPVKAVSFMNYQNIRVVTILNNEGYTRVDPISFKTTQRNKDLFIIAPDVYKPDDIQSIQATNQHEYILNNGKAHSRFGASLQFSYPFLFDNTGYSAKKICGLQAPSGAGGVVYDELNNRFLLLPTMTSSSAPLTKYPAVDNSSPAPAFDPDNLGNKTCLHLEEAYNKRVLAIMQDRTLLKIYAYQLKVINPVNGKMGHAVHDLSTNPDIAGAKYFTCSTGEEVLFYATESTVYSSTLLVGGTATAAVQYRAAAGEKITGMRMHIRGGKMYLPSLTDPNDYSLKRSMNSANRLLLLSTYNEGTKEGKIIAIPLETLGVGGLTTNPEYIRTYGGFGRITAFNFQGI